MRQKKRNRAWFEQKVNELGQAIEKLPKQRQLELFKDLEKESPREQREETGKETTQG